MDFVKNLKKLKVEHVILCLVGALFLIFLINSYSSNKSSSAEQMSSRRTQEMYSNESQGSVQPSQPLGQNETYASADGVATSTSRSSPILF